MFCLVRYLFIISDSAVQLIAWEDSSPK